MIEFLRILFFAKTVLLTPAPIDLFGQVELKAQEPLIAITRGAQIEVDVSSMIAKPRQEGILEFRHRLDKAFPTGSIEARLIGVDKREVKLLYSGNHAYTNDSVVLVLSAESGVPTALEFEKVVVLSRIKLQSVKVTWKNYMH